jgi:hypothetical protein
MSRDITSRSGPGTGPANPVAAAGRPALSKRSPSPHPAASVSPTPTRSPGSPTPRIVAGKPAAKRRTRPCPYPSGQALRIDLQTWNRRHWHIENRLHNVRGATSREDQHQARTSNEPPSSRPCVTPPSATTEPPALPTSPEQPAPPTTAHAT